MIAKSGYMVIISTPDPVLFASEICQVEADGCQAIAGQHVFYSNGVHVAYYVDPDAVPEPEQDVRLPSSEEVEAAQKRIVENQVASDVAVMYG